MWRREGLIIVACALLVAVGARADESGSAVRWSYGPGGLRFETDTTSMVLRNLAQVRFTQEAPDEGENRGYFDTHRYQVRLDGRWTETWRFGLQLNLADGSEDNRNLLEDAWVQYEWHPLAQLRVGQTKVPFGRQFLMDEGELEFVDVSIATARFAHGRDVGLALRGANSVQTYAYSVGVYNGNGINQDESENDDYLGSASLWFAPLGEVHWTETDRTRPDKAQLQFGVSVITQNQGSEGIEEFRTTTGALEASFRKAGFDAAFEFFTSSAGSVLGLPAIEDDTDGWHAQSSWLFVNGVELAGRYSEILAKDSSLDETELGAALGYHFSDHNHKVQLDWRKLEFETPGASPRIERHEIRAQLQLSF